LPLRYNNLGDKPHQYDRCKVYFWIYLHILVDQFIYRGGTGGDEQECPSVWRGTGNALSAKIATGAAFVLDDNVLPDVSTNFNREPPGDTVSHTTSRESNR
jgi:hypothetical protein